ncbi:HAD-IIIC family phosphatase [Amycolatopsis sp. DG1A-15b]|uniref:HAD-IIIC family phosphatase n=1 Tax=Amycolatopsis sp. DG1A-15b TaxID=3052846 RepID=UPI00255BBA95|nr:HAD-IIIC family phosphatase [Amycolatopsis sp. DG1A-15b]WIX91757.1 HAD-IIIC family phosphatase [Amycolatopsis sp. DG1A-15b]
MTGGPAIGGATLWDLYRDGLLERDYPAVRGLLTDLTDADFARAGQLLSRLDAEEILRAHPGQLQLKVGITGHGTLAGLVPPLTGELARHGILARPFVGDFDGYRTDLSEKDSELHRAGPGLCAFVLDPMMVLDELPVPWTAADAERVLAAKVALAGQLAARFGEHSRATLVLNTIPLPAGVAAQLVDHRSRARLGAVWREANARLLRLGENLPGVLTVDLDPLIAEGIAVEDARMSRYAKAYLSAELLARYARELGHIGAQQAGRGKKCLVLDLDETLWGGVLGEAGASGVEIGEGYRGEAFAAFQKVVKQIGAQGVLLAVVSKNDAEPVRKVLREHPRMVLREDDFVRIIANWQPKHDNLRGLAEALNLGVDSFVFVDDSPFECGLVRHELPGVAVVRLDEEPARHPGKLLRDGWFGVPELTGADLTRPVQYREELARKDFLHEFSSLEDYLAELGIEVRLTRARADQVPRLSQITLRTNQFNLTTRRLQPPELRALLDDPASLVLAIEARDRFGDNGVVGAVFYHREGDEAHIDNFLLSCRVFGRGIEQSCLSALVRYAKGTGVRAVYGTYRATAKNGKVKDFYPRYGFAAVSEDDAGAVFRHDLAEIVTVPGHVSLYATFGGEDRS